MSIQKDSKSFFLSGEVQSGPLPMEIQYLVNFNTTFKSSDK